MTKIQTDPSLWEERLHTTATEIAEFCQRHNIVEFALFGSVLRSDFQVNSDIDILVTYSPGYHLGWQDWFGAKVELQQKFGRPVDIVEKALLKNPYRRAEILKSYQVIYAKQ